LCSCVDSAERPVFRSGPESFSRRSSSAVTDASRSADIPFPRTKADRDRASDPRLSIEERYRNRDEYVGKFAAAALDLVDRGYLLAEDVADLLKHAVEHYNFATGVKK